MFSKFIVTIALLSISVVGSAQAPAYPPSAPADTTAPAAKPAAPATPAIDFSGILFANYQYRGDAGPSKSQNRFDVERAYLTFRMSAGKRTNVRITTDLFQQTTTGNDSYYRGWVVRAKYAYLQYNYLDKPDWKANSKIGLLHTVFIDHDEQFWPRWISTSPTERAGFFSSSDAGLSNTISLPRKSGEVYATITNGPGYTSRETDRFKDFAARLTLTPWAKDAASPFKTLDLSAWGYKGAVASRFVAGGTGQVGSVGEGLDRSRWGVHAGSATPKFTFGVEYARKHDEGENGSNTPALPRVVVDSSGSMTSGYALLRPAMLLNKALKTHPLTLMGRVDRVSNNVDGDAHYNNIIAGLIWDISTKASFSLDYQEVTPYEGSAFPTSKTYFAHFVARF
ncbi:MAG: hypothetical protein ABI556_01930 [Gemmatimonadales bacterium]